MPTKYHLTRSTEDADLYTFEFDFLYNYDVLLAENYTVEIILPYGATDFKIDTLIEYDSFHVEKSYSTLDFSGTPKLVIKKFNTFDYEHGKKMRVSYRFNQSYMLIKPFVLSLTVFAFYLLAIISNRITLSFNEKSEEDRAKTAKVKSE